MYTTSLSCKKFFHNIKNKLTLSTQSFSGSEIFIAHICWLLSLKFQYFSRRIVYIDAVFKNS